MGRARFLGLSLAAWTFVFSSSSLSLPVIPAEFVFPRFQRG